MAVHEEPVRYATLSRPGYRAGTDGTIWTKFQRRCWRESDEWLLMTPFLIQGHLTRPAVSIRGQGNRYVCHLVLEAFVGPCPEGLECCHNNGNCHDNRLDNLRWDTRQANIVDRDHHGTTARGEISGLARYSNTDFAEAEKYILSITSPEGRRPYGWIVEAHRLFGISRSHLKRIAAGTARTKGYGGG